MENPICDKHGKKQLVLEDTENKFLCRVCLFKSKDSIAFYHENFDKIKQVTVFDDVACLDKVKDYEGFENINKVFKETMTNFKFNDDDYNKLYISKQKFRAAVKEGLKYIYDDLVKKFEATVENLTTKTDKLDLTLKSAREEILKIQGDLDEQIEVLEKKEKLAEIFDKILKKFSNKFKYSLFTKFIDPEMKFNFKRGGGNNNWRNGTPIIVANNRGGSYWCENSEEVFEGAMFARLRINNISRKSDWSLNIGLIRAESTNTNSYYQDGVFFMCSGKITVQFQGNQGRNCFRQWNNGDEVLIRRDENNNVYFGLNDENAMEEAYKNITGKMRLCAGFSSSMLNDNIEIMEVDN